MRCCSGNHGRRDAKEFNETSRYGLRCVVYARSAVAPVREKRVFADMPSRDVFPRPPSSVASVHDPNKRRDSATSSAPPTTVAQLRANNAVSPCVEARNAEVLRLAAQRQRSRREPSGLRALAKSLTATSVDVLFDSDEDDDATLVASIRRRQAETVASAQAEAEQELRDEGRQRHHGAATARSRHPPIPPRTAPNTARRPGATRGSPTQATDTLEASVLSRDIMTIPGEGHVRSLRVAVRNNIKQRIEALRDDDVLRDEFETRCSEFRQERIDRLNTAIAQRTHHDLRPHAERFADLRDRRHKLLTQNVMGARSSLAVPEAPGDGLRHRRFAVLLAIANSFSMLSRELLISKLASHRHSKSAKAVKCLSLGSTLGENMRRWGAVKTIERAATRFAIARRIRVKREAVKKLREWLAVRAHMMKMRQNLSTFRGDVVRCQRICRAWYDRRHWRLIVWHAQWQRVEETLPGTPILIDQMVKWYERLVQQTLRCQHIAMTHQFLKAVRRTRRAGGQVALRGTDRVPRQRIVLLRDELIPIINAARQTIITWVRHAEQGANVSSLWDRHFQSSLGGARTAAAAQFVVVDEDGDPRGSSTNSSSAATSRRASVRRASKASSRQATLGGEPSLVIPVLSAADGNDDDDDDELRSGGSGGSTNVDGPLSSGGGGSARDGRPLSPAPAPPMGSLA